MFNYIFKHLLGSIQNPIVKIIIIALVILIAISLLLRVGMTIVRAVRFLYYISCDALNFVFEPFVVIYHKYREYNANRMVNKTVKNAKAKMSTNI